MGPRKIFSIGFLLVVSVAGFTHASPPIQVEDRPESEEKQEDFHNWFKLHQSQREKEREEREEEIIQEVQVDSPSVINVEEQQDDASESDLEENNRQAPPLTGEQQVLPSEWEEQPPEWEEQPPEWEEQPPKKEKQTSASEEQISVSAEQPPAEEQQPSVSKEQSLVSEEQTPTNSEEPPAVAISSDREEALVKEEKSQIDDHQSSENEVRHEEDEEGSHRVKRATYTDEYHTWPHDVPYVFDSSYPDYGKETLRRVMDYISDHVCVTFRDVTDRINTSNPNWVKENGFHTNAYIRIKGSWSCSAVLGRGPGTHERSIQPCAGFGINLHEIFHTLGVVHMQSSAKRDSFIDIDEPDILPNLIHSYAKVHSDHMLNDYFDAGSVMMYGDRTWSRNGLETYSRLRDDIFKTEGPSHQERVIFRELSFAYKCKENFCQAPYPDCEPGYYTLVKGKCSCVCPEDLDPTTNCKSQFNGKNVQWPDTPTVLPALGTSCPRDFNPEPAFLNLTGYWPAYQKYDPIPFTRTGSTINIPICTKETPRESQNIDWSTWPQCGHMCFIKPPAIDCGGDFEESRLEFNTTKQPTPTGQVGDVIIDGKTVTIKFCCKRKGFAWLPIEMPTDKPFRLIANEHCPYIRGMLSTISPLLFFTDPVKTHGEALPSIAIFNNQFHLKFCSYFGPTYDCNKLVTFSDSFKSTTITTPGFETAREPSRRCFYNFNVPPKAKLRLTFITYDTHTNDKVLIKRYHQWQNPHRIDNNKHVKNKTIVSENNYLAVEYWSSWEASNHTGLKFKVDMLLPADMCYNEDKHGEDYQGEKSITETYEDCVPWYKAVTCQDFPFKYTLRLLESGNSCRNPGGALDQPWCYTSVNDTVCKKRYCDVCNLIEPLDVLENCQGLVSNTSEFCEKAIEKSACFKTCNRSKQEYILSTCGQPTIPADGTPTLPLKETYKLGENVTLKCKTTTAGESIMECKKSGWTPLSSACTNCLPKWIPYGDRCVFFSEERKTFSQAQEACKSNTSAGILFQVKDIKDQQMIREFRQKDWRYRHVAWISGQLDVATGQWVYSDSNTPMTYTNWTYDADTSLAGNVRILAEDHPDGQPGGWKVKNKATASSLYICQTPREITDISDSWDTCEDAMKLFPKFCKHPDTVNDVETLCHRSCAISKRPARCVAPEGKGYSLVSNNATVLTGESMTFACDAGLYHTGGDLERACSIEGKLLGQEPVCKETPQATEAKLFIVQRRGGKLPNNRLVLLDHKLLRIPIKGRITAWYYMSYAKGTVHFLVYRKVGDGFDYVGENKAQVGAGFRRGVYVPEVDQITVQKGDVVGVYSHDYNTIYLDICNNADDRIMQLPTQYLNSLDSVKGTNNTFGENVCNVVSLSFRVEP